jgi:hypothetical protein
MITLKVKQTRILPPEPISDKGGRSEALKITLCGKMFYLNAQSIKPRKWGLIRIFKILRRTEYGSKKMGLFVQ